MHRARNEKEVPISLIEKYNITLILLFKYIHCLTFYPMYSSYVLCIVLYTYNMLCIYKISSIALSDYPVSKFVLMGLCVLLRMYAG